MFPPPTPDQLLEEKALGEDPTAWRTPRPADSDDALRTAALPPVVNVLREDAESREAEVLGTEDDPEAVAGMFAAIGSEFPQVVLHDGNEHWTLSDMQVLLEGLRLIPPHDLAWWQFGEGARVALIRNDAYLDERTGQYANAYTHAYADQCGSETVPLPHIHFYEICFLSPMNEPFWQERHESTVVHEAVHIRHLSPMVQMRRQSDELLGKFKSLLGVQIQMYRNLPRADDDPPAVKEFIDQGIETRIYDGLLKKISSNVSRINKAVTVLYPAQPSEDPLDDSWPQNVAETRTLIGITHRLLPRISEEVATSRAKINELLASRPPMRPELANGCLALLSALDLGDDSFCGWMRAALDTWEGAKATQRYPEYFGYLARKNGLRKPTNYSFINEYEWLGEIYAYAALFPTELQAENQPIFNWVTRIKFPRHLDPYD